MTTLTVPSFPTEEERDRRYGEYVATGYSMVGGMWCLVSQRLCVWRSGEWRAA